MNARQHDAIRLVLEISEREHGERLDKLIASRVTGMSRSFVQQLMKQGAILVNGQPCKPAQRVRFGDRLEVYLPPVEPPSDLEPEYLPIPVIYEDDEIIVFDKPPGIVTHPAPGHEHGTLVNALKAIRPDLQVQPSHRPGIVHRLDKDTSGLLVVAKTEPARLALLEQWQSRSVVKRYTTLVHGVVEPDSGTIDAPISRDPRERTKMAVVAWGRPAITHFRVLERFQCATLLDVTIETGRTHQIRVHCAFIGHPVVGDQQYGGNRPFCVPVPRQFLHARYLRFRHPTTGRVIELETPLPWDLRVVLERLRTLERERVPCQARG
ncbi:RluA family pseudouridine synthase [Thermomicrobium sp. 4228-Ro]|uniref:RluA family pseudouridine synthase n=1 Tax=Thermomicrobium sp. 4228-Ro TaxID=2993937 RepID=UPI002249944E|nr:RluA family pseudouridine synthase [Thermomicrobium sp. 4228-Ro]MCX2727694.1 RluA family pseudouridine synthase [Thermomicrobium sp. 4228-Ro]